MAEVAGLVGPVLEGGNVRPMTEVDARAIRASDDADALLALQYDLRTGTRTPGRKPVTLAVGAVGIVLGVLIINQADFTVVAVALIAFAALIAVGMVLQSRAKRRIVAAVGWLGAIQYRLSQLAANG